MNPSVLPISSLSFSLLDFSKSIGVKPNEGCVICAIIGLVPSTGCDSYSTSPEFSWAITSSSGSILIENSVASNSLLLEGITDII